MTQTHETYILAIVGFARERLNADERNLISDAKITYGAGGPGRRGVTYFNKWSNGDGPEKPHSFVEICAFGESNPIQIAGTTLHELAHVVAGPHQGHGKGWKEACARVGLRHCRAAGQAYSLACFAPDIRALITQIASPADGAPVAASAPRPCSAGVGVRGGKSRGKGSGSRQLKVSCPECGYTARVSNKWLVLRGPPLCPCNTEPMEAAS